MPLATLRARVSEIPTDRKIVLYCDIGLRSYEGALVLRHAGLRSVGILEGGLAMWPYETLS
jgi:rhodanese-related sulfurtransferase